MIRVGVAILVACILHRNQYRKVRGTPTAAHPIIVTGLVLEMRGTYIAAIAAALHDVFEDVEGLYIRPLIQILFGKTVVRIIDELTEDKSLTKRERNQIKIDRVRKGTMSQAALTIKMADILHNSKSVLSELERDGPIIFEHYDGGHERLLWYYKGMLEAFNDSPSAFEFRYRILQLKDTITHVEAYIIA